MVQSRAKTVTLNKSVLDINFLHY